MIRGPLDCCESALQSHPSIELVASLPRALDRQIDLPLQELKILIASINKILSWMQTSRIIEHGVSETRTTAGETPAPDDDCVRQSKSDSPDQIRTSALNNTSVYVVRIRKKATPNY